MLMVCFFPAPLIKKSLITPIVFKDSITSCKLKNFFENFSFSLSDVLLIDMIPLLLDLNPYSITNITNFICTNDKSLFIMTSMNSLFILQYFDFLLSSFILFIAVAVFGVIEFSLFISSVYSIYHLNLLIKLAIIQTVLTIYFLL